MIAMSLMLALSAQAQQPGGTVAVQSIQVARPVLSLPDVLAPALKPYVECLLPTGPVKASVAAPDCSKQRSEASSAGYKLLKRKLSEYDRRELIEAFLLNLDAITAHERDAR